MHPAVRTPILGRNRHAEQLPSCKKLPLLACASLWCGIRAPAYFLARAFRIRFPVFVKMCGKLSQNAVLHAPTAGPLYTLRVIVLACMLTGTWHLHDLVADGSTPSAVHTPCQRRLPCRQRCVRGLLGKGHVHGRSLGQLGQPRAR